METKIVLDFIHAINCANVIKMCDLMAIYHIFIDSQDNRTIGKETMRQAWMGYFTLFPDYKIEVTQTIEKGSFICILGYASAAYKNLKNKENSIYWRIPAAWTATNEAPRRKRSGFQNLSLWIKCTPLGAGN